MPETAVKAIVRGRVQRVGFRRYVLELGQELGLAGWVKNRPDGGVEVFAQGPREALEAFLKLVREAPPPARVDDIEIEEMPPQAGLEHFKIIYGPLEEELQEGFGVMQAIFMEYWKEFREFREEFRDFRSEFRDFRNEFRDFREEFRDFRKEFRDFREEFREFRDEFRDFREEFRELRDEFRDYRQEFRKEMGRLHQEIRSLAEGLKTSSNPSGAKKAQERGFEFLEHTADQYVRAYGPDMRAAFEEAAKSLFATMTDISKIEPIEEIEVEVSGEDLKALLYNWLEALLVRFDVNGLLLSDFEVLELSGGDGEPYRLRARARGERFDPEKHPQYVGVKGITYHLMEIEERPGRVELRFLLDI